MPLPRIVELVRAGATLNDLQAAAGKLWLDYGGAAQDNDGEIRAVIDAYWRGSPGNDPYWKFLGHRTDCDTCGETFKYENLSICPNCFRTYCYRHGRQCRCGHKTLG